MAKARFSLLCIILSAVFVISSITVAASSINELQKKKETIERDKKSITEALEKAKNEKNVLQQEVIVMDYDLELLTDELESITELLDQTVEELKQAEQDLMDATISKDLQLEALVKRLRIMDENGSMAYLQILFSSNNIADFLNRFENINTVAEYDRNMFSNLEATEKRIEEKIALIEVKKQETELLLNEQTAKKIVLEENTAEKVKKILELSATEQGLQAQATQRENEEKEIDAAIKKAQADAAQAAAIKLQKEKEAAEAKAKNVTYSGTGLAWPLPGYSGLSSSYGWRKSPTSGRSQFHSGLDIPAPKGTQIKACASGVVITSSYLSSYGYTVVIDHGGGIATQYSHCSSLIAKVGDQVSKGQTIAKVGSTGNSTGPHLHLEVQINGTRQNPSNYVRP